MTVFLPGRATREADLERRAAAAVIAEIMAYGERAAAPGQRWRIARAVYPFGGRVWPVVRDEHVLSLSEVLADCRRAIAGERQRGREGHWTYDPNRMMELRSAEMALLKLLGAMG